MFLLTPMMPPTPAVEKSLQTLRSDHLRRLQRDLDHDFRLSDLDEVSQV